MQLPAAALTDKNARYVALERALGSGGNAEVVEAIDALTQTHVAVKTQLLPSEAAAHELRVYRILQTNAPCPHVATMLDFFVADTRSGKKVLRTIHPVASSDLWALFCSEEVRRGRLEASRFGVLMRGAADGLAYLHGIGIVHGDATLKNFLLEEGDRVMVSDFGSAHSAHAHFAPDPSAITTSYVRSPEKIGLPDCGFVH